MGSTGYPKDRRLLIQEIRKMLRGRCVILHAATRRRVAARPAFRGDEMELTDEQVLAELREDERERTWAAVYHTGMPTQWRDESVREMLRRLALSRIEAREAAAREREACAALVDDMVQRAHRNFDHQGASYLTDAALHIRARGGAA